jgi:hypothetical protein
MEIAAGQKVKISLMPPRVEDVPVVVGANEELLRILPSLVFPSIQEIAHSTFNAYSESLKKQVIDFS